jgi:hypothetical protein
MLLKTENLTGILAKDLMSKKKQLKKCTCKRSDDRFKTK